MAFDITSVLKNAQVRDGEEQLERIDLDLIDPDPNNFYSLDGLDELAGNIELIGLQQPLRVRPGSQPGRYTIVSGHRRRAALLMIRDGYDSEDPDRKPWEKAACIVEYGEASEAMRELRLIYANAATRIMTSSEQSRQAERVTELLYQLKEQGVEFPGRMRDHVAEACQISRTKLARLHAIRANLDAGLLERFDRGEIPEETAYQLQRLPKDIQEEADAWLESGKRKNVPKAHIVEFVVKNLDKYLAELPCRAHAGGPDCHWKNEKILRSLFAPQDWNVCRPGACCRDCYSGSDCGGACQECKDRRKLEKDAEAEKEAEREKARQSQQLVRRQMRKNEAKRLLPVAEAAGLEDSVELPGNYYYNPVVKIKELREMAAGEFGDKWFNEDSMLPTGTRALTEWAEILKCSTDYLLGRTDVPTVATEAPQVSGSDSGTRWSTGTPTEIGEYVMKAGARPTETEGSTITTIKTWTGEGWVDAKGVPLRLTVYRWIRLPEE